MGARSCSPVSNKAARTMSPRLAWLMKSRPGTSTVSGPGSTSTDGIPAPLREVAFSLHLPASAAAYEVAGPEQAEIPAGHGRHDDGQVDMVPPHHIRVGG